MITADYNCALLEEVSRIAQMHANNSIHDLHGMLNSIRVQIQFLKASLNDRPWDRELQRRLRKATSQEQIILGKLTEYTTN
jgi:hypothetical protein